MKMQPEYIRALERVHALAQREHAELYLIGGVVRDLLLDNVQSDSDIDFLVVGVDSAQFATKVSEQLDAQVKIFAPFLTAKVCGIEEYGALTELDFALPRAEKYEKPGALPLVHAATLHEDLARRDFTINALALPVAALLDSQANSVSALKAAVVDRFSGVADLEQRVIRILHQQSFVDDPTRIYRALRYQVRFHARLEQVTEQKIVEAVHAGMLSAISWTRHLNELKKVLLEADVAKLLELLLHYKMVQHLIPLTDQECQEVVQEYLRQPPESAESTARLEVLLQLAYKKLGADRGVPWLQKLGYGKKLIKKFDAI